MCSYSSIKSVKAPLCIHTTGCCDTAPPGTPGGHISLYSAVSEGSHTVMALLALHRANFQQRVTHTQSHQRFLQTTKCGAKGSSLEHAELKQQDSGIFLQKSGGFFS